MEIVDPCSAQLFNREVLDLLKTNVNNKPSNLATILYETTSYLESSPISSYSSPELASFQEAINEKKYDLSKMEKIQLANLRPRNETELHLVIDNIEEKFTDEQRSDLLNLIETMLNKTDNLEENARKKIKL